MATKIKIGQPSVHVQIVTDPFRYAGDRDTVEITRVSGTAYFNGDGFELHLRAGGFMVKKDGTVGSAPRTVYSLPPSALPAHVRDALTQALAGVTLNAGVDLVS